MLCILQIEVKTLHQQKDYDLLCCGTCFIMVVWNWIHNISEVCLLRVINLFSLPPERKWGVNRDTASVLKDENVLEICLFGRCWRFLFIFNYFLMWEPLYVPLSLGSCSQLALDFPISLTPFGRLKPNDFRNWYVFSFPTYLFFFCHWLDFVFSQLVAKIYWVCIYQTLAQGTQHH